MGLQISFFLSHLYRALKNSEIDKSEKKIYVGWLNDITDGAWRFFLLSSNFQHRFNLYTLEINSTL
jgi:predicted permease